MSTEYVQHPQDPTAHAEQQVRLSEREAQILDGLTRGMSNSDIGRELFISEDTVKTICKRLYVKLGVHDRAHAVHVAWQKGLLGPVPGEEQ